MKGSAFVLLLFLLLFLGVLHLGAEKSDHSHSSSFSEALDQAISRLEGKALKVTVVVIPRVNAAPMDYPPSLCMYATCDDNYTCYMYQTCDATCGLNPTCDDYSPTCTGNETCSNTCNGFLWCGITCQGQFTCDGSATCDGQSPTCSYTCGTWPTCQGNEECKYDTYDGGSTCDGTETCSNSEPTVCAPWPTCDDKVTCAGYGAYTCDLMNPACCTATERTSWGKLKKKFE